MFTFFDTQKRVRQTDGQTQHDGIGRAMHMQRRACSRNKRCTTRLTKLSSDLHNWWTNGAIKCYLSTRVPVRGQWL